MDTNKKLSRIDEIQKRRGKAGAAIDKCKCSGCSTFVKHAREDIDYLLSLVKEGGAEDDYVAWCRYTYDDSGCIRSIVTCDSDAKGAFKVYRATTTTETSARCGECGHNNLINGVCAEEGSRMDHYLPCGCECTFPAEPIDARVRYQLDAIRARRFNNFHGTAEEWVIFEYGPAALGHAATEPAATTVAQPEVAWDAPSSQAWRDWFDRLGERATADVVNATADLVIAEREIKASTTSPTTAVQDAAIEVLDSLNFDTTLDLVQPDIQQVAAILSRYLGAQQPEQPQDFEWALRELAEGWISSNQREGEYGFNQNTRRVLEGITADLAQEVARLNSEVERLKFDLHQSHGWIADIEEREAAVCPEDMPFDEYIRSLKQKLFGAALQQLKDGEG